MMNESIRGKAYVVDDNIDTDQIVPGEYLSLVPTIEEEYKQLGGYAMCGLPNDKYPQRFVEPGQGPSDFAVIIAGRNFGCGSSREHAPIALGAAGVRAVIAESFARIFFRNCISTGEFYPIESEDRLCEKIRTGQVVKVNLGRLEVVVAGTTKTYRLQPLGEVEKVVSAGGLFAYARRTGLVGERSAGS